jgi:demethylmenaquinone methyltransferase/2-methoxy-6-polyprenyl-1,4-benzoquinol methylase
LSGAAIRSNASSAANSDKASTVRSMFAQIAPTYDMLNHLLSLGVDRRWRRFTARKISDILRRPGAKVLDLCCGTCDLSLEMARTAAVWSVDFCHPMLVIARDKTARSANPISIAEGDALSAPFADRQFDAVTIAFGLRNLDSPTLGLREIHRLLKPAGTAAILEFSHPVVPLFGNLFQFYFGYILPRIGSAISGSGSAYRYLHDSVQAFPDQETLSNMMLRVGFSNVTYYNLSGGIAALHLGVKLV